MLQSARTQFPSLRPEAKPASATPALQKSVAGTQDEMRHGSVALSTRHLHSFLQAAAPARATFLGLCDTSSPSYIVSGRLTFGFIWVPNPAQAHKRQDANFRPPPDGSHAERGNLSIGCCGDHQQ